MTQNIKDSANLIYEATDEKDLETQELENQDTEISEIPEETSCLPDESTSCDDKQEKEFLECTVSEIYELAKSFPGENIMEDISSDTFKLFVSGHSKGDPSQIYSDYIALKKAFSAGAPEKENLARVISGQETGTREHSGFDTYSSGRNVMCGLTKRQMEIARESGMSYREYEELLDSVPKTRMR